MKAIKKYVLLAAGILLFCLMAAGRPASPGTAQNNTTQCLLDVLAGVQPPGDGSIYAQAAAGQAVVCLDVQTAAFCREYPQMRFSPVGLSTAVFAIDPSQTDLRPDSWQALMESSLDVSYPNGDKVRRRCILAAVSYGLSGPAYEKESGLAYLHTLQSQGRLKKDDASCPVQLCMDTDLLKMDSESARRVVIVPRDGTLCFAIGLLADHPVPPADKEKLLATGLRLTESQNSLSDRYEPAVRVTDFDRFDRATQDAVRDLRRRVWGTRLYHPADGRENILTMTGTMLLVLFWTVTALQRTTRRDIRRWVGIVSGQILCWLLLVQMKYNLPEISQFTRLCWYSYYIFLMGLPLCTLYMAAQVDRQPGSRSLSRWKIGFGICYLALLLLVFTNDRHRLVFRFDLSQNWSDVYSYGPGYYMVFVFAALCFVLALALLILKSRKSPRRFGCFWPVLTAAVLLLFNVGYITGVPLCRDANLAAVFSLLSVLFAESLLRVGLIPNNNGYRRLFAQSPLAMQLLDRQGNTWLAAASAAPLTESQKQQVLAAGSGTFPKDADTLLHSRPIAGGFAVWQEDIAEINGLHRQLRESIRQTEKANLLLGQEERVRREKISAEVKVSLFEKMEQEIQTQTGTLTALVRELTQGENHARQLAFLPLLLCQIKRRCNLFFLSQENTLVSTNELAMYLDELSEFAGYADCHAVVRCGLHQPLPVEWAALCYDFYYYLLTWSLHSSHATLIGQLEETAAGLVFRVLSTQPVDAQLLPDRFLQSARQAGAALYCRQVEDTQSIQLTFIRKGGSSR